MEGHIFCITEIPKVVPLSESGEESNETIELIRKFRSGDPNVQDELINRFQSYVALMADRNLGQGVRHKVGASDVVQQTMIKMVNGIEQFRGDTTNEFIGWLNQILTNEIRHVHRDLKRQKRDVRLEIPVETILPNSSDTWQLPDHELTPRSNALSKERLALFYKALKAIPDDHATVIRLRNIEQLSFNEVADVMGRTRDAVAKLWSRAIVKFEAELNRVMNLKEP